MKILVQADGIQLTPESENDQKLLDELEAYGCRLYPIEATIYSQIHKDIWRPGSYRLVKGEKDE